MAALIQSNRFLPAVTGIMSVVGFLAVIELLLRLNILNPHIMPYPTDVFASIPRIITEQAVFQRFLTTAGETLASLVLIVAIGVPLGVMLHRNPLIRKATESWFSSLAAAPIVLAYPLFLVVFGRNASAIVALAVIGSIPPVVLKTVDGLSATRQVLVNVGRAYSMTNSQIFWRIMVPSAIPSIFVGIRLGLIFALVKIVGVEFLINFGGLGQLINELAERYDLAGTYAAIIFVIAISVLAFTLTEWMERWLTRK